VDLIADELYASNVAKKQRKGRKVYSGGMGWDGMDVAVPEIPGRPDTRFIH
jgi:hypothetical protein